jgi:DNA-binding beta-propeller fold protein YncE
MLFRFFTFSLFAFLVLGCNNAASIKRGSFPFARAASQVSSGDNSTMHRITLPTQRERAPEFPSAFAWVNTDHPLRIGHELKGRVVVLDFWTYCCINCMHVLPDLEYLEREYAGQPIAVVGVHSAKFDNEGDRQNIATACARYNIAHPIIVDEQHRIWSDYGVRSWPTLVIIDPQGRVVGTLSGEGNRDILDAVVHSLLEEGREKGTLAAGPPEFQRQGRVPSASGLAFPGKVLAEPSGKLVFISDSNHDRIIIADPAGRVLAIAGSGQLGMADGSFEQAEFHNPQGLAYDVASNSLYVADTDNHFIRKLDLNKKTVETIAGTGEQVFDRTGGGIGRAQGLNSPWDLALDGNTLYIAMAGSHQLWTLDLTTLQAQAWVGSGGEDIEDGTGLRANLAQPSGLALAGDWLYFADSEVSAVRKVNRKTRKVETLIGQGLFDFGDRTGKLKQALLQHPLGVAVSGNDLLVADTYNHKIKRISEAQDEISTLASDGTLSLYEPGGLSVRGDSLYIADTNHDRVLVYDLAGGAWHEFRLQGLQTMAARNMDTANVAVQEIAITPGRDLILKLNADFPAGIHLNRDAPINYTFLPVDNQSNGALEGLVKSGSLPVEITIPAAKLEIGKDYLTTLSLAYCTEGNQSLCVPVSLMWRLHLMRGGDGLPIVLKSPVRTGC